jgi:hypothetical protein
MLGFQGDARTLYNRWKQLRDKYGKEVYFIIEVRYIYVGGKFGI